MSFRDPYAEIPAKAPVPPCTGWLVHNRRLCDCYVAERAAADRCEARRTNLVCAFFLMWPVVVVAGWLFSDWVRS